MINSYLRHAHPSLPSRLSTLPKTAVPGVTIIRPICGLDDNLYNALQASMRFDYPKYQVIFALQDERDEAIPVVRMIMERYPEVDSRLIIGECCIMVYVLGMVCAGGLRLCTMAPVGRDGVVGLLRLRAETTYTRQL